MSDEQQTAEEAQDAAELAAFNELDGETVEKVEPVEEPTEAVEAEPEKAAPAAEVSAEYEAAKKRLAFAKLDPENFTEEQAITLAATLREEQVSKDRLLQEAADLRKQVEAKALTSDGDEEQSSELGRPTEQPTPEPVDVTEMLKPFIESAGLGAEDGEHLGKVLQTLVQGATQPLLEELGQLRGGYQDLAGRALLAEYTGKYPDLAGPQELQELATRAQALAEATPNGDFEAEFELLYNAKHPAKEVAKPAPKLKQPKTGSTPSTRKPLAKGASTEDERDYEAFLALDKK